VNWLHYVVVSAFLELNFTAGTIWCIWYFHILITKIYLHYSQKFAIWSCRPISASYYCYPLSCAFIVLFIFYVYLFSFTFFSRIAAPLKNRALSCTINHWRPIVWFNCMIYLLLLVLYLSWLLLNPQRKLMFLPQFVGVSVRCTTFHHSDIFPHLDNSPLPFQHYHYHHAPIHIEWNFRKCLSGFIDETPNYVSWPNLVKIGRCEIAERSCGLPQKNLSSAGLVPAPILPKMGRSRPKLPKRCHPLTCLRIPILVQIGCALPDLLRKDWFFGPKSNYNRLSAYNNKSM